MVMITEKKIALSTSTAAVSKPPEFRQNQFGVNHLMVAGAILAEAGSSKMPPPGAVRPLTAEWEDFKKDW